MSFLSQSRFRTSTSAATDFPIKEDMGMLYSIANHYAIYREHSLQSSPGGVYPRQNRQVNVGIRHNSGRGPKLQGKREHRSFYYT